MDLGNGEKKYVDEIADLGALMAAVARVEGKMESLERVERQQLQTGARVTSLHMQHETLAREVTALSRDVGDLLESTRAQFRVLQRIGRLAPALVVGAQIAAALLHQLGILK